jgi:very-short-patch-repair endonuclease
MRRVSRAELDAAVAEGRVLHPRRGLYSLPRTPPVVVAAVGVRGVVSHATAAKLWGCDTLGDPGLHVTVPHKSRRRAPPGVVLHFSDLKTGDRVARPWPMTSMVRAVIDCARYLPLTEAVVIGDSAMRIGVVDPSVGLEPAELDRRISGISGPGSAKARRALRLLDPKAESVLESLFRVLIHLAGFPAPITQARLLDGRVRVDFYWPRRHLVVEVEGYEFHSGRADWVADCRRFNDLVVNGYRPLRLPWDDVRHGRGYVVAILAAAMGDSEVPRTRQLAA